MGEKHTSQTKGLSLSAGAVCKEEVCNGGPSEDGHS